VLTQFAHLWLGAAGSTAELRKAAAEQVSGIARAHPSQLPALLRRVSAARACKLRTQGLRSTRHHCQFSHRPVIHPVGLGSNDLRALQHLLLQNTLLASSSQLQRARR